MCLNFMKKGEHMEEIQHNFIRELFEDKMKAITNIIHYLAEKC